MFLKYIGMGENTLMPCMMKWVELWKLCVRLLLLLWFCVVYGVYVTVKKKRKLSLEYFEGLKHFITARKVLIYLTLILKYVFKCSILNDCTYVPRMSRK